VSSDVKKNNLTLGRILLSSLVSLFVAVSCFLAGMVVPASFQEALGGGGMGERTLVGPVGAAVAGVATWLLGPWLRWLFVLLPWAWSPLGAFRLRSRRGQAWRRSLWFSSVLLLSLALLGHPVLRRAGMPPMAGGVVGSQLHSWMNAVLGQLGAFLVPAGLVAFLVIRVLPPLRLELAWLDGLLERVGRLGGPFARAVRFVGGYLQGAWDAMSASLLRWRRWREEAARRATEEEAAAPRIVGQDDEDWKEAGRAWDEAELEEAPATPVSSEGEQEDFAIEGGGEELSEGPGTERPGPTLPGRRVASDEEFHLSRDPSELLKDEEVTPVKRRRRRKGGYPLPSLDLLDDVVKENRGFSREVLQMNARLLLETLSSFGIEGRINQVRPGPVVTTFEFEPDRGVKVSQITSRADDLALAMRAIRIRIVAPIPGKAAVGIEVPNSYPQIVTLKEVLGPLVNQEAIPPLTVGLGKDPEGAPVTADLADMPHLLVAGATGSGKSVCLNSLICSLLLRNDPDQVRFLMIDPKMLELSLYNGIPHLLHPVITDAKEALKALKIMVSEMTVRYNKLARQGVRNIVDYNTKVRQGKVKDAEGRRVEETMPYIVIIVDELADLMMLLGAELETPIARLAQMARAVGIHLVLATQRPSVNVITGVIKANFPSRIGFRVISKVDSRTILDVMGAESLLGKGDSLFLMAGMTQPQRIHGAYLSTEECERIAQHWIPLAEEEQRLELDGPGDGRGALDLGEDELLEDARRIVILAQSGSTSMLQRKLRVGYTRAARLMDMLEEIGVVGPFEGSKAREVLIKPDEFEAEG